MAEVEKADEREKQTHRRGFGVSTVYETLRNEIIELRLAPGSPIDELQLSERFSLSRTPIREALVRLSAEGLITTLTNRATIVSQIDFLGLPEFFDALTLMYRVTTRLAAANHTEADIAQIRTLQSAFALAVEQRDALSMISTNRDFHVAIAQPAATVIMSSSSLGCSMRDGASFASTTPPSTMSCPTNMSASMRT